MKKAISILGPTHSGKTDLAINLNKFIPSEIISVDSVQIYKQANIGSNKPKKGAHDKPVIFLHPKDFYGTLIELEQA